MAETKITVRNFGPCRTIGLSYSVRGDQPDFPGHWDRFFQLATGKFPATGVNCFGICRCTGATDGSWEYVATAEVSPETPVPEGMIEVSVPGGEYATTEVQGLGGITEAWNAMRGAAATIPGAKAYCDGDGCDCAHHPCFEFYGADYEQTQRVGIYIPFCRV